MTKEYESWLTGCIRKRTPDALCILSDLLQAGLSKGEVSSNDIRHRDFEQPNIIGCTIRLLPKFGFLHTDRRTKSVGKQKHSRRVDIWTLEHRWKAELALQRMRDVMLKTEPSEQGMLKI